MELYSESDGKPFDIHEGLPDLSVSRYSIYLTLGCSLRQSSFLQQTTRPGSAVCGQPTNTALLLSPPYFLVSTSVLHRNPIFNKPRSSNLIFQIQRAIHIHAQVHTNWTVRSNGTLVHGPIVSTGQIFVDEKLGAEIMALEPYASHTEIGRVKNEDDGIYTEESSSTVHPFPSLMRDCW